MALMNQLSEHYMIMKEIFSPDNDDGIFQKDSFSRRICIVIFHFFAICIIINLVYFTLLAIGLLTTLTVWYDYDIRTGCLTNQTCTYRYSAKCNASDSFTLFFNCMMQGVLSTVVIVACITLIVVVYYIIYKIVIEFKQAYERTKKRYEYQNIDVL